MFSITIHRRVVSTLLPEKSSIMVIKMLHQVLKDSRKAPKSGAETDAKVTCLCDETRHEAVALTEQMTAGTVHSSVVSAADCRSAGPWFNSGWRSWFNFMTWSSNQIIQTINFKSLCFLLFVCVFKLFIFLFLQFTVNKWDEVLFRHDSRRSCFNERGAATPWQTDTSKHVWRLPELVDTMQYVVRVEQRTAMCQSMCSEPLSSTSATTNMFMVLLSGRFCLQNLLGSRRKRCSLTKGPVNKVKLH